MTAKKQQFLEEDADVHGRVSIKDQAIQYANIGDVTLAYLDLGNPEDRVIVLVAGFGQQLAGWSDGFVNSLILGGYRVILFDNRDVGLSSKFSHVSTPIKQIQFIRMSLGFKVKSSYTLEDMASDVIGLMDHLDISDGHIAGVSMGGLIAHLVAEKYPGRTSSMVSIMSTSGDPSLPSADKSLIKLLLSGPGARATRKEYVDYYMLLASKVGSRTFSVSADAQRERFEYMYDRNFCPEGVTRQLLAVLRNGDNTDTLKRITVPCLVINGEQDPICLPPHARHIAALIPNSRLVLLKDMGHGLEKEVSLLVTNEMMNFYREVDPDEIPPEAPAS